MRWTSCAILAMLVFLPASAQEEVSLTGSAIIDRELKKIWEENEVKPSGRATDAEFLRRVTLDLIGTIPSLDKTMDYLGDDSAAGQWCDVTSSRELSGYFPEVEVLVFENFGHEGVVCPCQKGLNSGRVSQHNHFCARTR